MKNLIEENLVRAIVAGAFQAHDGKEFSVEVLTDVISESICSAINSINTSEIVSKGAVSKGFSEITMNDLRFR
ncbi:MAG: hypothetical protein FWF77_01610 [Defluviitaleaceae bacterium]|nr:hypothetical protein [Defluviitaleaceae bacterium]